MLQRSEEHVEPLHRRQRWSTVVWTRVAEYDNPELATYQSTDSTSFGYHEEVRENILQEHPAVFSRGVGKVKGREAKVTVERNSKPRFNKARLVPYAIRPT